MTPEERVRARQAAYEGTFMEPVSFDVGKWALIRLCLSCLFSKRPLYRLTFQGAGDRPHPPGQAVLDDLRKQAGIDSGGLVVSPVTRTVDSHASLYRAGRRDIYLRIAKYLGTE